MSGDHNMNQTDSGWRKRQIALNKKAENARELGLDSLYSEPLANHELNCVCGAVWCGDEMVHLPHKSTPPQRTWVGLTDEERDDLLDNYITAEGRARAIEAKLKEKNT